MFNFDIFRGNSVEQVMGLLSQSKLSIPAITDRVNFTWDSILIATFKAIPDEYLPLMQITFKDDQKLKVFNIDRDYIYRICYKDIVSTSRFYFKNLHEDEDLTLNSLIGNDGRKRNVSLFRNSYLFYFFGCKLEKHAQKNHLETDPEYKNIKSYTFPGTYAKMIHGILLSIKNCPSIYDASQTFEKCKNFYDDILSFEDDSDMLHFLERHFSIILATQVVNAIKKKSDFYFSMNDALSVLKYLTKLPNIIGRNELIRDLFSIQKITSVDIEYCPSQYPENWMDCIQYICLMISRKAFPYWEALIIIILNSYFNDNARILEKTSDDDVNNQIKDLFTMIQIEAKSKFAENMFKDVNLKINEHRFPYENDQLEYHGKYIPSINPCEFIAQSEIADLNFRSIYSEE